MSVLGFQAWMRERAESAGGAGGHLILGGTGHLLLSEQEERNVIQHLEAGVLPRLLQADSPAVITVMAGLAPGSDLLLMRTIAGWLQQRSIGHRLVGLLPVPAPLLVEDWRIKLEGSGITVPLRDSASRHWDVQQMMADCHQLVDLAEGVDPLKLRDNPRVRQDQYRRLAAVLAEHSDVLIAVLRGQSLELPGGTAEVVEWRRHPNQIPAQFADMRRVQREPEPRRQLIVIDPLVPFSASQTRATDPTLGVATRAREALRAGNYLACYDQIGRARARGIDSPELQYLMLQALANAGSANLAMRRYQELEQASSLNRDEDWLALKGRLFKDLAFRGGADSGALFRQSAEAYEAAYAQTGGSFSGINAASMWCLGGEAARSATLAAAVAASPPPTGGDQALYFHYATCAEAALLLGDGPGCAEALTRADRHQLANINARSRTRMQLLRLCRHLRQDPRWVAPLSLPPVVYVPAEANHPPAARSRAPSALPGPLVYLGLAAPSVLNIAEQYLDQGALLYLALASERALELHRWRQRYGDEIGERFARCVRRAHEVAAAHGFLEGEQTWSAHYVDAMALGLSRLAAFRLGTEWQLHGAEDETASAAQRRLETGSAADDRGRSRRYAGLIFADFVGFSGLGDALLPVYWQQVMGAMAEALQPDAGKILFRHTWGDALHLITQDAASAARIGTRIREALERVRPQLPRELAALELRLSMHFAPVFIGLDPIEEVLTYYGTQVSFAARIEPVTPPGVIFVTETFAAQLMLEAPARFQLEYAGELELAKNYGKYRLFSLRKAD